ncbi:MAG: fibronectin type III domain-containing protein, partial [Treponema sp.]|nr:fibronectin type III domain-containing protein [Treponema sp.]
ATDKAAVEAALAAYEALHTAAKALLGNEKTLLDSLKTKINELTAGDPAQEAADTFKETHAVALGKTTATVTAADKAAVEAALSAYEALHAAAKALLGDEKTLLDSLKAKIDALPGVAANLSLAAPRDKELGASWDALTGATGYEIYYSENAANPTADTAGIAGVTMSGATATISGLKEGTTYYVWVRGVNTAGKGLWSVAASRATLRKENLALSFAIGGADGTIGANTITLKVPFAVADFTPVITLSPGASGAFTDTGSFPGTRTYRVSAENGATKDYTVTVIQPGKIGAITLVDPFTEPDNASLGAAFILQWGANDGSEAHQLTLGVDGATDIKWYVDNRLRGRARALTLYARDYGPGYHYVSVEFVKDGKAYDANLVFTVAAEDTAGGGA